MISFYAAFVDELDKISGMPVVGPPGQVPVPHPAGGITYAPIGEVRRVSRTRPGSTGFVPIKKIASPGAPKGHPDWKTFKKHRTPLTPEERKAVMDAKAVWHHGKRGAPTPAVSKAVIDGKTWFETHTHRALNYAKSVKGAIGRFHKFIEGTA